MNGSKSGLPEVLWKWVIWLSEFTWSVSELTEMLEWTITIFEEMLAHLSLVLLLKCVEMSLTTVEIVII